MDIGSLIADSTVAERLRVLDHHLDHTWHHVIVEVLDELLETFGSFLVAEVLQLELEVGLGLELEGGLGAGLL